MLKHLAGRWGAQWFLAAAATLAVLLVVRYLTLPVPVEIRVDMAVSGGGFLHLYVNGTNRPPFELPLVAGRRHVYTASQSYFSISRLRLDPTDLSDAEIRIYSISVEAAGRPVHQVTPQAIHEWANMGLAGKTLEGDHLKLVSAGGNPVVDGPVEVEFVGPVRRVIGGVLATLLRGRSALAVTVAALLIVLLAGLGLADRHWHLPLAVACAASVVLMIRLTHTHYHELGSIQATVGRSAYLGWSWQANRLATWLALLLSVGLGLIAYVRWRSSPGPGGAGPSGSTSTDPVLPAGVRRTREFIALGLIAVALLLALFPDLSAEVNRIATAKHTPDWDANNMLTWHYLARLGYAPLRDFWYPYGSLFLEGAGFLPNRSLAFMVLLWAGWRALLYFLLIYLLVRLAERNMVFALFTGLALLIGEWTPVSPVDSARIFAGTTRFLPSVLVVLSYLTIDPTAKRLQAAHGVFGLCCMLAIWSDVTQLVVAAVPVLAILLADLVRQRPGHLGDLSLRFARTFTLPAISLLAWIAFLIADGRLAGALDFYLKFGDLSQYHAGGPNLFDRLSHASAIDRVGMLWPFAGIGIAIFELCARPEHARRSRLLLGLAMLGLMWLQKDLVRGMGWQLFMVFALAVLAYLFIWRSQRHRWEALLLGVACGVFVAILSVGGGVGTVVRSAADSPRRMAAALQTIWRDGDALAAADRMAYTPERFEKYRGEQQVAGYLSAQGGPAGVPRVFVLGDANIVYLVLRQIPPYQVNVFNGSPIYEQLRVLDWLHSVDPPYVVWNPADSFFDSVPNVVRAPLIYNAVLLGYVPHAKVAQFEVLRRRRPQEPVAVDFWRRHLGADVPMGHLARAASFDRTEPCREGDTERCGVFLQVRLDAGALAAWRGKTLTVPFVFGEGDFSVSFAVVSFEDTYRIFAERLWFWQAARDADELPRLALERMPRGVTASLVARRVPRDVLY